jgi:hypothetical protein
VGWNHHRVAPLPAAVVDLDQILDSELDLSWLFLLVMMISYNKLDRYGSIVAYKRAFILTPMPFIKRSKSSSGR